MRRPHQHNKYGRASAVDRERSGGTRQTRLGPGNPAAHARTRLPLLPSGPGGVHGRTLRGTRPSTPACRTGPCAPGPRAAHRPRCSGLRVQGTAASPSSTAKRSKSGGRGGIRTRGGLSPTHALQACRLIHLRTLPKPLLCARRECAARSPDPVPDAKRWRRGWDSNPRCPLRHTAFREPHLQPLGHPSVMHHAWPTPSLAEASQLSLRPPWQKHPG